MVRVCAGCIRGVLYFGAGQRCEIVLGVVLFCCFQRHVTRRHLFCCAIKLTARNFRVFATWGSELVFWAESLPLPAAVLDGRLFWAWAAIAAAHA